MALKAVAGSGGSSSTPTTASFTTTLVDEEILELENGVNIFVPSAHNISRYLPIFVGFIYVPAGATGTFIGATFTVASDISGDVFFESAGTPLANGTGGLISFTPYADYNTGIASSDIGNLSLISDTPGSGTFGTLYITATVAVIS